MDKSSPSTSSVPLLSFREGGSIPQIGYGTYELRNDDCIKGVTEALRLGYRHIDTASVYRNETEIAKVLADPKLGIKRGDIFITSKIGPSEQGYAQAKTAVAAMLARLQVSYLDCVLIHWPGVSKLSPQDPKNPEVRLETWKALMELKSEGIIKHIGVSNFNQVHLEHLIANSGFAPEMNQFELHPLCIKADLIKYCESKGILVQAYSPLARNHAEIMTNPLLLSLAKTYKKTLPQIVLRWALQNKFVIIPKSKTPEYIADNFNILDFSLTADEVSKISALNKNLHTCWDPVSVKY